MRLLPRLAAVAAAALSCSLLLAPADARPHHHAPATKAQVVFEKNRQNPFASKVVWREYRKTGGHWVLTTERSWRAGSGMGGRRGLNPCIHNVGWLPDGTYRARAYADYPGHLIHGHAFRLSNKACGNGTLRHDLFIHTETGPGNHQCANRPGDQGCRWEFPQINDYRSNGCVKMSPSDLSQLMWHFRHWERTARRVDVRAFRVLVTG